MATISLFYDAQREKITLNFSNNGQHARYYLPVSLNNNQWDKDKHSVINHPNKKELNVYLQTTLMQAQTEMIKVSTTIRVRSLSAAKLRDLICGSIFNDTKDDSKTRKFVDVFTEFTQTKERTSSYKAYLSVLSLMRKFDKRADFLNFEDITPIWLDQFDKYMAKNGMKQNSRAGYIMKVRAAMNYALINEYTNYIGFKRYKAPKLTAAKRYLTIEEIRDIFNYRGKERENIAVDILKLIFLLRGINFSDLEELTHDNVSGGRLCYTRLKTGKYYDIKLEKETRELLKKYKGEKKLISFFEVHNTHGAAYNSFIDSTKIIEAELGMRHFTSYFLRHSWATFAFNDLNIPAEVISMGLGHSYGSDTTDIYINKNNRLADKANRLIIDYVFYGKEEKWTAI